LSRCERIEAKARKDSEPHDLEVTAREISIAHNDAKQYYRLGWYASSFNAVVTVAGNRTRGDFSDGDTNIKHSEGLS